MDTIFAIFFVIILVLRGINWFVKQLKGSEQAPILGQKRPPAPRARSEQETPLQSVMRMLEEAGQEGQRREEERRQRAQPQPQPRPGPRRTKAPVLRAKPVPQPLSQRHLDSAVDERHLPGAVAGHRMRSALADRHTGTRSGADRLTGTDRRRDVTSRVTFWELLQTRTPLQRAVILKEVLGPPRSARGGRGRARAL